MAEYPNGKVKATKDTDRKPIVLARVRRYLTTGQAGWSRLHWYRSDVGAVSS